ncbi:gliding motility-associated peptidyl-prolyl isomerase GldI [Polaribacter pectinis]|uniref:Peptidyl-prolyl cis-trans isomerase n=1 Tax=Polaribacter pectinis TaxID=2738844 RepID=A0A7G9LC45_9FLAO|nr:gliding motility-associated peptidyl-prolyl isomerase GldI [Polaribacter pectinis]QNM86194.1 gliding motility-associated peptidyl-prolyl isomerase GldI [Polaribacter pectinis]
MKIRSLFFLMVICFSCSKTTPRKPINPKPSSTILKETISASKVLNEAEDAKIIALIQKDSTKTYITSPNGFWYTYLNKVEEDIPTPQAGQEVTFSYNITDLNDVVIYSTEELGIKKYKIDKEDFIAGIQKGIKLMKIGETITFVIPSYNAFGISGDGNKIAINQSIKSTVTLLNIN